MASKTSIAIAQADALKRITARLDALAKEKGRSYAPIPTTGRDAVVLSKNQLTSIADAFDVLLGKATDADRDTEDSSAQDTKDIGEKAVSTTTKKGKG
jgi:hypothetical protein